MVANSGATVQAGGIFLPDLDGPQASFTFILPRDYAKNTPITILASYHSVDTDCTFVLQPGFVVHRRPGVPVDGTTSVFAPKNGSLIVDATADPTIPGQKSFALTPGGTLPTIRRGDQFFISLLRNANSPDDTCTGLVILEAIEVRYTTP